MLLILQIFIVKLIRSSKISSVPLPTTDHQCYGIGIGNILSHVGKFLLK